jgi:hypothetical protein
MNNFNALSDCINSVRNSVVSPSGAPAAGALPVFSSPTTVAPGDLSGDCTTSGTVAVTCTKTNGTPFGPFVTGTDAGQLTGTVSVNRFANGLNADSTHFLRGDGVWAIPAGSGGSTPWWFRPPQGASFTKFSNDATLPAFTDDSDEGLIVDANANAGVLRGGYVTLSNKAADWTLTVRMESFLTNVNYTSVGIWGRDSVSGKVLFFGLTNNVGIDWARFNSIASWNSDIVTRGWTGTSPNWLRIAYSGGNYTAYISYNGRQWFAFPSIGDTAWTTNKIDQVGFSAARSAEGVGLSIQYWDLSGPGA